MIVILDKNGKRIPKIHYDSPQVIVVVADTADDLKKLGTPVSDGDTSVPPEAGSIAFAVNGNANYIFSPSGKWINKTGGAT